MRVLFLAVLLSVIILAGPFFATNAEAIISIIDPHLQPFIPYLPCSGATAVLQIAELDTLTLDCPSSGAFCVEVITSDVKLSGTSVGRMLTNYRRYFDSGLSKVFVGIDDAIISTDGSVRIYGSATNTVYGTMGSTGVITSVVVNGVDQNIKGTYSYTNVLGTDCLCIFAH